VRCIRYKTETRKTIQSFLNNSNHKLNPSQEWLHAQSLTRDFTLTHDFHTLCYAEFHSLTVIQRGELFLQFINHRWIWNRFPHDRVLIFYLSLQSRLLAFIHLQGKTRCLNYERSILYSCKVLLSVLGQVSESRTKKTGPEVPGSILGSQHPCRRSTRKSNLFYGPSIRYREFPNDAPWGNAELNRPLPASFPTAVLIRKRRRSSMLEACHPFEGTT